MKSGAGLAALAVLMISGFGHAQSFAPGSVRLSVNFATGAAFGESYTVAGIGAGYFPSEGLELGLDGRVWLGGDRDLRELTPSVTYVFTQLQGFRPYVGALYRKTFIENYPDLNAYGGRAGMVLDGGGKAYTHVGFTTIRYLDCDAQVFENCTETYPEVSVGLYF